MIVKKNNNKIIDFEESTLFFLKHGFKIRFYKNKNCLKNIKIDEKRSYVILPYFFSEISSVIFPVIFLVILTSNSCSLRLNIYYYYRFVRLLCSNLQLTFLFSKKILQLTIL